MEGNIAIAVTGTAWMGGRVGSVSSTLERLLSEARQEVLLTAYAIGTGAGLLLDQLDTVAARGVRVILLVNRYDEQPHGIRMRLDQIQRIHSWFEVHDFSPPNDQENLHAKVVVVDRRRALIGSANLSHHGLSTNYELAVLVDGEAADVVARAIDHLLADRHRVHPIVPREASWSDRDDGGRP